MIVQDIINESIPTLKKSSTGLFALNLMDELKLSHLAIQHKGALIGLISDTDIYSFNHPDDPIGDQNFSLKRPFVFADQHIFDAIKMVSSLKLTLLPVLGQRENYLGSITLTDLVKAFSTMASIDNPGGIIILEMSYNDYSLSEIAHIIESNDARVLNLCVTTNADSTRLEVIIKTNRIDINPILQTFNRYNYQVKATFAEKTNYDDMKERLDEFLNFLNI